jgi:uncharacterized OsmC-like protein
MTKRKEGHMGAERNGRVTVIREKVAFLSELFTDAPAAARVDVPSATAILESGLAFRAIHPDGASLATDMPIALGGTERAPSPGWLLSAAAAACCATTIAMRSAQLGVDLTTLEVSVTAGADVRGMLGVGDDVSPSLGDLTVLVEIGADGATDGELEELVSWAAAHSTVMSTLRDASKVAVDIEIA